MQWQCTMSQARGRQFYRHEHRRRKIVNRGVQLTAAECIKICCKQNWLVFNFLQQQFCYKFCVPQAIQLIRCSFSLQYEWVAERQPNVWHGETIGSSVIFILLRRWPNSIFLNISYICLESQSRKLSSVKPFYCLCCWIISQANPILSESQLSTTRTESYKVPSLIKLCVNILLVPQQQQQSRCLGHSLSQGSVSGPCNAFPFPLQTHGLFSVRRDKWRHRPTSGKL